MSTRISLLRHGHCHGGNIFRGQTDSPLSDMGWQQLQTASASLEPVDQIICSPLRRCAEFAQQFARQNKIPSCNEDKRLMEIDFGRWEGQAVAAVQQREPERLQAFWDNPLTAPPPAGETMAELQQRVRQSWQQILQQGREQHSLIISHGGVIRCILAEVLGMSLAPASRLSVPHACLSRIDIYHQPGKTDWPQLIFHQPLNQ
ncbi:MAG: histidine phosphatase family protein [Cellvibrionaceae bacterium]|nr:histidine phosphatase family protein [Cellvibrionaceae bacterium]